MADLVTRSNGTEVAIYNGASILSTYSLPGATAETPGRAFATRYAAYFLDKWWVFQAQGIWSSYDKENWTLTYTPPSLTATNSGRVGLITLNIQGISYLCGAYNTTSTLWSLLKSTDGENWDVSTTFNLSTNDIARLTIYGNRGYCFNSTGTTLDSRILDWGNNLIYETTVATSVGAATADMILVTDSAVLDDGLYITVAKTTIPRGFELYQVGADYTFPRIITPSVDISLDTTARASAYYYQPFDAIYVAGKRATSGIGGYKTNVSYTGFTDVTSSLIPSALQTDTDTTVIQQVADPNYGVNPVWNFRVSAANLMESYNLELTAYYERFEPLAFSGGDSRDYLSVLKGVNSLSSYLSASDLYSNKGLQLGASIIYTSQESTDTGKVISTTIYSEVGGDYLYPVTWGTAETGAALTPATISAASLGTISGNTISLSLSPGYTNLSYTWNILADNPSLQQAYQVGTGLNCNITEQREEALTVRASFTITF